MYIVDLGLRNHILPCKNYDLDFSLENIVYFRTCVADAESLSVRSAIRKSTSSLKSKGVYQYFQVTADMTAKETFYLEIRPLESIRDNYEKTILTMDRLTPGNYNGIQVQYLPD